MSACWRMNSHQKTNNLNPRSSVQIRGHPPPDHLINFLSSITSTGQSGQLFSQHTEKLPEAFPSFVIYHEACPLIPNGCERSLLPALCWCLPSPWDSIYMGSLSRKKQFLILPKTFLQAWKKARQGSISPSQRAGRHFLPFMLRASSSIRKVDGRHCMM